MADEAIGVKKGRVYVVFHPSFYQYMLCSPLVFIVCNVRIKTRPARQSSVEVSQPSSCRSVNV